MNECASGSAVGRVRGLRLSQGISRLVLVLGISLGTFVVSGDADAYTLNPSGGRTSSDGLRVDFAPNTQLQIWRQGAGQVYSPDTSPPSNSMFNSVYLAVGSTVYGASCSVCVAGSNLWTQVSQSAVTGVGTAASPWTGTTVVRAGAMGPTVSVETTYVLPDDYFGMRLTVDVPAGNTQTIKLYHMIDTYLGGSDAGPAYSVDVGGATRVVGTARGSIFEAFITPTPLWSDYWSGDYYNGHRAVAGGGNFGHHLDTSASTDNGIGAEWNLGAAPGRYVVFYRLAFAGSAPCASDGDCGTAGTHCDPGIGSCFRCVSDAHCGGATPNCDSGTHSCRGCSVATQGADCESGGACNAATGTCVVPAVVLDLPSDGATLSDRTPVVTGTATPGQVVSVLVDGAAVGTVTASGTGTWSLVVPTTLAAGRHRAQASITVASTPVLSAVHTFTLGCASDTDCSGATSHCDVAASTCVACTSSSQCGGAAPVCDASSAACRPCGVDTQSSDCAGGITSACSAATGRCVEPVVTIDVPAEAALVTERRPPLRGHATPGQRVTVRIDGAVVGTAIAAIDGTWTVTPTVDLPEGDRRLTATVSPGATPTEAASHFLVGCNERSDCSGARGLCDVGAHTCVACLSNSDCAGDTPLCATASRVCTADSDSDGDGVLDMVERRLGSDPANGDSDGDGLPDGGELGGATAPRDSDGDGLIDALDPDDDNDTVLTRDERPGGVDRDSDSDSTADYLDADDDNDTLPTRDERPYGRDRDTDGNGTPDRLQADDDDDGIDTRSELALDWSEGHDIDRDGAPSHLDTDADGDSVLDRSERGAAADPRDADGDARPDFLDDDDDDDGLSSISEVGGDPSAPRDTDGDRAPDYRDDDDDDDTIPTATEVAIDTSPAGDSDMDSVASYLDTDSDGDGVSDREEVGDPSSPRDSDSDGARDFLDADDDNDTIPTRDERVDASGAPTSFDHDGDGLADYLDADDDGDTIPTWLEVHADESPSHDMDGDGAASYLDIDSDGDSVRDAEEVGPVPATPVDTDRMNGPDFLDTDSDNDCVPDSNIAEAGPARIDASLPRATASDNCSAPGALVCDTRRGLCFSGLDADGDGLADEVELRLGTDPHDRDTDSDGVLDGAEVPDTSRAADLDGDGIIDALDADDDGDTAPTRDERAGDTDVDSDGDGLPDWRDADDDNDLVLTRDERPAGTSRDTDSDGVIDQLDTDDDGDTVLTRDEVPSGIDRDTDLDGTVDRLDSDDDGDSVPTIDERPGGRDRDTDHDGIIDRADADDDGDLIPTAVEVALDRSVRRDVDRDGTPSYLDTDADGDGAPDRLEAGVMPSAPRNTDGDDARDFLDGDDDNDTIATVEERILPTGAVGDRDTDGDRAPDFVDRDDDNDSILTSAELRDDDSAGHDLDGDSVISSLDTDSDGDGATDRAESGIDGSNVTAPVDTDHDGHPDYLDLDSDNDCGVDSLLAEAAAGRITVDRINSFCGGLTPVCNHVTAHCEAAQQHFELGGGGGLFCATTPGLPAARGDASLAVLGLALGAALLRRRRRA